MHGGRRELQCRVKAYLKKHSNLIAQEEILQCKKIARTLGVDPSDRAVLKWQSFANSASSHRDREISLSEYKRDKADELLQYVKDDASVDVAIGRVEALLKDPIANKGVFSEFTPLAEDVLEYLHIRKSVELEHWRSSTTFATVQRNEGQVFTSSLDQG